MKAQDKFADICTCRLGNSEKRSTRIKFQYASKTMRFSELARQWVSGRRRAPQIA